MRSDAESDTSFPVQTPEGIAYSLYPAGLPIRFFAYVIDSILQGIVLVAVIITFYFILDGVIGIWLILLFRFVLDWFYHVLWELLCRGQSPGKRFLGIRVVLKDGNPVNAEASFLRNLLRFADGFLGLYFVAFISAIASKAFRRPGDWAAGTLVIYTWQSLSPERGGQMSWLDSVPPAAPGRALSSEEKQGILMFARRYPLLGPARAGEIAGPLAASLGAVGADTEYLLGIARTFAGEAGDPMAETLS